MYIGSNFKSMVKGTTKMTKKVIDKILVFQIQFNSVDESRWVISILFAERFVTVLICLQETCQAYLSDITCMCKMLNT